MKEFYVMLASSKVDRSVIGGFEGLVGQKNAEGYERFHLAIIPLGGNIEQCVRLNKFLLQRIGEMDLYTYNLSNESFDPASMLLFCAGKERIITPNAVFAFRPVVANILKHPDRKTLEERIESIKKDQEQIAKIIAKSAKKEWKAVERKMEEGEDMKCKEALAYGLATKEQKTDVFPHTGAEFYTIV